MNKAAFDRKYKAIKGHMLEPIHVLTAGDNEVHEITKVIWDEEAQVIFIIVD